MSYRHVDPNTVMDIIQSVAALTIEPRFKQLKSDEIKTKTGPRDLVTIADIEAEEELERQLCALLPGSIAIGEEAVSKEERSIDSLSEEKGTFWVIDPVDGTNNFAGGIPVFGTMVALVHNGELVQSWIYDIPGKKSAIAEKGGGATINGTPVKILPSTDDLGLVKGFTSTIFAPQPIRDKVEEHKDKLGSVEAKFCCAHEYMRILEGSESYAVYTRTKPWDHLPGNLLINEAGGYMRRWNNENYEPRTLRGGILCASDPKLWQTVYDLFLHNFVEDNKLNPKYNDVFFD